MAAYLSTTTSTPSTMLLPLPPRRCVALALVLLPALAGCAASQTPLSTLPALDEAAFLLAWSSVMPASLHSSEAVSEKPVFAPASLSQPSVQPSRQAQQGQSYCTQHGCFTQPRNQASGGYAYRRPFFKQLRFRLFRRR